MNNETSLPVIRVIARKCQSTRFTLRLGQSWLIPFCLWGMSGAPVQAYTLEQAFADTYRNNPRILATRASLRGVDEDVRFARGGFRPTLSFDAAAIQSDTDGDAFAQSRLGLELTQSLYDGSATRSAVQSATARVEAARNSLATTTQRVLLDAATVYADLLKAEAVLEARQTNLAFLGRQLSFAQSRFKSGTGTSTAIAQTRAQQAGAQAELAAAQAELASSRSLFAEITGKPLTETLQMVVVPALQLPESIAEAMHLAGTLHPALRAALASADAASHDIEQQRSAARPRLQLAARVEAVNDDLPDTSALSQEGRNASLSLQFRVPIYQAGQVASRVRQAAYFYEQRQLDAQAIEQQIRASVQASWHQLTASRSALRANISQIEAAGMALDGRLDEQRVGLISSDTVLTAQQDLLAAQIAYAEATRNEVVAAYTLMSATGQLMPSVLELPIEPGVEASHGLPQ